MEHTQVYSDTGQTAILGLQRQGARLVRMRPDGKRPAHPWGGRTGRCLTDRQAESWLGRGGRFALVPYSIGFSVMDVDDGPWQDLAEVYPPHAVIPSRKRWRRHLYYPDNVARPNAQRRILGCQVDIRSGNGYVAMWQPEAILEAAESPRQSVLFPWWTIWPVEDAQGPPKPPGTPPAPPAPRDGPLSDAYPSTRWVRLLEVVKTWAYDHAREYSDRDLFHAALREYAEGRAREIPDLTDFWDSSTNDPAKAAYYVEGHAWRMWRPVHSNNWRWHRDAKYDLEARDTAALSMRTLGVSQEAIVAYHGVSQGQVSRRLQGVKDTTQGYRIHISVSCCICGSVFSAARASARYCGEGCKQRAKRARKRGLER